MASKFSSPFAQTLAILTLAAVAMTTLLALLPDAGHDQQWLLLAAERMLGGPVPHLNPYGPTVFESNPPLAIWLSAAVVALAHALHLSLTVTFKLVVILLAAASAAVSGWLLRRLHPDLSRANLWLLAIAFILIFGCIPARDFGQRDHILTLLILPYLIAAALKLPRSIRIPITLVAALGLALKPHQALIAVAVELTLLLSKPVPKPVPHSSRSHRDEWSPARNRLRLLEPAIFLLGALAYFSAIHLFAPTYLTQIVPILRDTYWAFGHLTLPQLLLSAMQLLILAAVAFSLYLLRRPTSSPLPILLPLLLAAATAATLAYLVQGTGWYYQQLPALSLFALTLCAPCLDSTQPAFTSPRWLPPAAAAVTLLSLLLTVHFSNFRIVRTLPFPDDIEQRQPIPDPSFFVGLPPETAVATLTTEVDDSVPPAFRYHLTLAQRYPHLWMLPAILRNQSGPTPRHPIPAARLAQLDRLQHQMMVQDLTRWHPALILVERCQDPAVHCQVLEDRHDNLLAWFLRDPAFAAIFAHYHLLRSSGPYDAYKLG